MICPEALILVRMPLGASSNRCGEDKALKTGLAVVFSTTGQIQGHIFRGS